MSGIYLTVWEDHKEFDRVLKPTTGGWPHITLAYTGKNLSSQHLKDVAKRVIDEWALKKVTLSHAYVNTFFHERSAMYRHDVLMGIEEAQLIEDSRDYFLREPFDDIHHRFSMIQPHVTAKICWTKEEAEEECCRLCDILPTQVTVTGVTIK